MVKGIYNAFDHKELCFVLKNRRIISVKIGLFFQEITFITEFPGSNFLLPTFLTGVKWDFQVSNLLLAIVNFEPCIWTLLPQFGKVYFQYKQFVSSEILVYIIMQPV